LPRRNCANTASNAASGYGRSVGGGDLETDIGERPLFGNRHRGLERLLLATPFRVVDGCDAANVAGGGAWWEELTGRGGEGMVDKPADFVARNARAVSFNPR
jgi:hypothetical protein